MAIPEISVIMPVYNASPFLREAIDSIIAQTYENWELILLNDASTDDSLQIAKSYTDGRIRIFDSAVNKGLVYQLNRGIIEAKGKYIARLDADDVAVPQRLQIQYRCLEENSEIGLLGGVAEVLGTDKYIRHGYEHDDLIIEMLCHNPFVHSTVMFRKELFKLVTGGFSEEFKHAEDYQMCQVLAQHTKMKNMKEVLVKYRIHEQQVSLVHERQMNETANKVRNGYISSIYKIDIAPQEVNSHLAIVTDLNYSCHPKLVLSWIDKLRNLNKTQRFFNDALFNSFLDQRAKRYVHGYYLWFNFCDSPIQWLRDINIIFKYLKLKEMISSFKKCYFKNK